MAASGPRGRGHGVGQTTGLDDAHRITPRMRRWEASISRSMPRSSPRRLTPRDDVLVLEELRRGRAGDGLGRHGPVRRRTRTLPTYERVADLGTGGARQVEPATDSTCGSGRPSRCSVPMFFPLMRRALRDGIAPGQQAVLGAARPTGRARSRPCSAVMCVFHVVGGMLYAFLTNVLTFAAADLGDGTAGEQSVVFAVARIGPWSPSPPWRSLIAPDVDRVTIWAAWAAVVLTARLGPGAQPGRVRGAPDREPQPRDRRPARADTHQRGGAPAGLTGRGTGSGGAQLRPGPGSVVLSLLRWPTWARRLAPRVRGPAVLCVPLIWMGARHLPESRRFVEPGSLRPSVTRVQPRPVRLPRAAAVPVQLLRRAVLAAAERLPAGRPRLQREPDHAFHRRDRRPRACSGSWWVGASPTVGADASSSSRAWCRSRCSARRSSSSAAADVGRPRRSAPAGHRSRYRRSACWRPSCSRPPAGVPRAAGSPQLRPSGPPPACSSPAPWSTTSATARPSCGWPLAPLIAAAMAFWAPETSGRELEELNERLALHPRWRGRTTTEAEPVPSSRTPDPGTGRGRDAPGRVTECDRTPARPSAAASSSGVPNGSRSPQSHKTGTKTSPRCSVRNRSGRPGGAADRRSEPPLRPTAFGDGDRAHPPAHRATTDHQPLDGRPPARRPSSPRPLASIAATSFSARSGVALRDRLAGSRASVREVDPSHG